MAISKIQAFKKWEMVFYSKDGTRYSFDNLLTKFTITHTRKVSANVGKFEITNLSDEGAEALSDAALIEFYCGYEGDVHLAFVGELDDDEPIEPIESLVDKVTKFVAYDGQSILNARAQYNPQVSPGDDIGEAISKQAGEVLKGGLKNLGKNLIDGAAKVSTAITGKVVEGVNGAIGDKGDLWVSDGELKILMKNAVRQPFVTEFTNDTGSKFTIGKKGAITVETHLHPSLRPGQIFRANGGDYDCHTNMISGDTKIGAWSSKIEGLPI